MAEKEEKQEGRRNWRSWGELERRQSEAGREGKSQIMGSWIPYQGHWT
jgi:hypothetical protein